MTIEALDQLRSWANTGFLGFLAFCAARFATPLANYAVRRMELNAEERKQERDGYGPLIDRLEANAARLQSEIERLTAGLAKCQEQHEADGRRIATLEAEVIGLNRAVVARSATEAMVVPASPKTQEIAERVARAVTNFPVPDEDMEP